MRKSIAAALLTALIAPISSPALAGEEAKPPRDLAAEVRELQEEIARLREAVARLAANSRGTKALTEELLAIAKKLEAGGELGAGEIKVLLAAMRAGTSMQGRGLAARARGLIRKLPPALRAELNAAILMDLAADGSARDGSLRELVAFRDGPAREAILKAIELERLLPAVYSGYSMGSLFSAKLIRAVFDLEEKGAVDAAVAYCRGLARSALERAREPGSRYGYRIWGRDNRYVFRKLAAWSGDEGLLKYAEGGRGGHEIKTVEAAAAFGAEVEKVAAWWKANREAFKFPAPPPAPAADAPAPGAADGPKPATQPKDPEMF